jgi:hypothetical protein
MSLVSGRCARGIAAAVVTVAAMVANVGSAAAADEFARCVPPRGAHVAPTFAAAHPRILVSNPATLSCLQSLLTQQAPSAVRFKAWVDDELAHASEPGYVIGEPTAYGFEPWFPALLYRITGERRYAEFAVASAEHAVAAEEARVAAGQAAHVAHDSYLYVGEAVGSVALVYDWCFDLVTPTQRSRWVNYMNQAVANVWNPAGATWGGRPSAWSGWSIENPSNNYYYSFLRATMLLGLATRGDDPRADQWITQFRTTKIGGELVPTFLRDLVGGGSREGTGYGVAMKGLFGLYDWWERSTGERIADLTPHAEASMAWMTGAITPSLDRIVMVGDHPRDSGAWLFDYHREYLLALSSLYAGSRAASVARQVLAASTVPRMTHGFERFADYLYEPAAQPTTPLADYTRTYYGSGSGMLTTRSSWGDPGGTLAALVCGPFTESHAHMQQGAFELFRGEWLAPTGNRYSHSGIVGGPAMQNLVRFTSSTGTTVGQENAEQACRVRALADAGDYVYASVDASGAYASAPEVVRAEREFVFVRPSTLVVFDRVESSVGTQRVWTLNLQGAPSSVVGDHLTYRGDESAANRLDVDRVAPAGLSYAVHHMDFGDDTPLDAADLSRRVDVVDAAGTQSRFLHVLGASANGASATSNVVRDDAPSMTGTTFQLADGRSVTVRFANGGPGGTIELRSASGAVTTTTTLPTTVTVPPLFAAADAGAAIPTAPAGPVAATSNVAAPTPTPAAGGAVAQARDPWTIRPQRSGRRVRLTGVRVRPSTPGACPKHGSVIIRVQRRRLVRARVSLAADGALCRVTSSVALRLPARTRSVRVTISGRGIAARSWTVR